MSETKYTPGPWILGGMSGRMITIPSGYVGDGFIADVDTLANARLISAAPELLDALKQIVFITDRYGPAWLLAKAAIRKAEGSQP